MLRPASPLDILFRRYGLDRPSAFRPVDAGLLNRSFQVVSAGGSYFLKHYLPWRGGGFAQGLPDACGRPRSADATLRWQHHAATALAATGFPAAAPLTDRSGDSLVRMRGRPFAVFPWIDGVHRTGTEWISAALGTWAPAWPASTPGSPPSCRRFRSRCSPRPGPSGRR